MLSTIKLNSTGDLVQIAQYLSGYAGIKQASNTFNSAFDNYIKTYQKEHNLEVDGIIGKNTWTEITKNIPTCSTSKNKKSAYTCAIQILLGDLVVDGIYGTNTKKAVATYQSANNLDVDGVCGPKTWGALILGKSEPTSGSAEGAGVVNEKPVDYKQGDSRWGKIVYSTHTNSQTISNSGCGPTAMADIVATWWDKTITPKELCALSVENGFRTYDSGTAWGFFKFCATYFGAYKFIQTSSIATLKSALQEGAYAVVSFGPSKWTSGGHYCCIWKWDGKYFYINDPASSKSERAKGTESEVNAAKKQFFIFYNEPKVEIPKEPTNIELPTKELNLNGKIIDISKYQGTIDFDKLKSEVSLVIARASCGSDKDIKIDEYAKAMNERGIPFGVYCYSYAGTKEKAIDEVQKMIQYVSKYNPLFYVMDAEEERLTTETIKAFAEELRKETKKPIGCYVAHHRYKTYNYSTLQNLYDFTWIPRYGSNDGTIEGATKPAYFCDLWQYTSTGKIAGISGNTDMNVITGDGHDLKWFLNI